MYFLDLYADQVFCLTFLTQSQTLHFSMTTSGKLWFWFDGNDLFSEGIKHVCSALKNLKDLSVLSLCDSRITDHAAYELLHKMFCWRIYCLVIINYSPQELK